MNYNFAAIDFFLWAVAFALETLTAFYAFRNHRTVWPLWLCAGFMATSDAATFLAKTFLGNAIYGWAFWYQYAGVYLLEMVLAVYAIGHLVNEKRATVAYYAAWLAAAAAFALGWLSHAGEIRLSRLLDGEIAGNMALGVMMCLGLMAKRARMERPWAGVTAGLLTLAGSDALCSFLQAHGMKWDVVARLYPLGQLAGLAVWAMAARDGRLSEFRIGLGQKLAPGAIAFSAMPPKIEPGRVVPAKYHRWVM